MSSDYEREESPGRNNLRHRSPWHVKRRKSFFLFLYLLFIPLRLEDDDLVVQQYIYSRSWTTLSFDDGRLSGRCRDFYRLFCLLVFFFFFLFSRLCLKVVKDFLQ